MDDLAPVPWSRFDRFVAVVERQMKSHGWDEATEAEYQRAFSFSRPLDEDFLTVASFYVSRSRLVGTPPERVTGRDEGKLFAGLSVGATCPRFELLLKTISETQSPFGMYENVRELTSLAEPYPFELTRDNVDDVASRLVELAKIWAEPFASANADVDAWVDYMRSYVELQRQPDEPSPVLACEQVPVLLAAFGRGAEAREALALYGQTEPAREYEPFSSRLRRYLDVALG